MKQIQQQSLIISFRRWSRKGYSAFASLGRCVVIGVLSVGMSILSLVACKAHASEAADSLSIWQTVELRDVGVTSSKGNPTRSAMLQTPIFDRATEAAAPIQTLESALRLSPSIDVRERSGKATQADISIRGGSFDQTMVLLNGINFMGARTGHQTHVLPIDIESVAGIELVDGVAGVGAYAGAINFRTAPLRDNYVSAQLSAGDYGYLYNSLSGAFTRGKWQVFGAGSFRKSDGYTYNTSFSNWNGYVRSIYDSPELGLFDIQVGYQKREFGANGFYSLSYPDQYQISETALGSLRWVKELSKRLTLNSAVSYSKNLDNFMMDRYSTTDSGNFHNTDNVWAELYAEYNSTWGVTTLGGDYTFNHIWSTMLGIEQDEPNGKYTNMDDRHIGNFYLRHKKSWDKFGAAAYVGVGTTPYGTYPLWSVSGSYRPLEGLCFELGATESMRLPTFTDLYYQNSTRTPNPDLQPEQATTYLLSARFERSVWSTLTQIYYRDGRNIIDWTQSAEERAENPDMWYSRQFTELGTFGVEFNIAYAPDCFLRRVSASYGYTTQSSDSAGYSSLYAFEYMQNKGVLTADFALCRNLTLVVTGSLYDRAGDDYDLYYLLDARVSWSKGCVKLFVDATNLTSTEYYDYTGLVMPEVWASGGIEVLF